MTSLFDKIAEMIGSLVRKPGEAFPGFHTGGIVSPETLDKLARSRSHHFMPRGNVIFQGNPPFGGRMEDYLRQRRHADKIFHIQAVPPKTRKRPITGDMTQMCQDLGIEPSITYEDFQKQVLKAMASSMGLTPEQLIDRRWAR